jgi:hypothetical protein
MPFDQCARLAEQLRTGRIAQWAELIGRFRQMAGGMRGWNDAKHRLGSAG